MIPYQSPRGSIHDLEHLATLGADRNLLLCVSERTLYVLLNLTALDVTFRKRYAEELEEGGYVPVNDGSPLYGLYQETVEAVQLEVLDMSCDLVTLLQEWIDAAEALPQGQDWQGVYDVPGYATADYYDEDPTSGAPPPDSPKCQQSWSFCLDWAEGLAEMLDKRDELGVGLGLAAIAMMLELIAPPIGIIASILILLVGLALQADFQTTKGIIDGLVSPLACAIYTAGNVGQAKAACESLIQAAPSLNQRTKDILKAVISYKSLNAIWAETYPVRPGAPTTCDTCTSACDYELYLDVGNIIDQTETSVECSPEFFEDRWQVALLFDVNVNGSVSYCVAEDGKNVTNILSTNNLLSGWVYDRDNVLMDQFSLWPPNENLPVFPYNEVGKLQLKYNTGETGNLTVYFEEP